MSRRAVTIRDVAREAGVGLGTVSRVLNGSAQVSVETRERVLQAIQQLGFRPNKAARQLSRGVWTPRIGVVLPFLSHYAFVSRLRGMQAALSTANSYELVLYNVGAPDRFPEHLAAITQDHLVEGLLVVSLSVSEAHHRLLHRAGITFVSLDACASDVYPCLAIDNVAGGRLAVETLLALGHRRIAYVGDAYPDPYGFMTSIHRCQGYTEALTAWGVAVDPAYIRLGEHGRDVAAHLTTELLALPTPPTAIFAMSDYQALGVMAAVRAAGLDVPGDISVIGFDDIEIAPYVGLTTVRQSLEESGLLAMRYLLDLLEGGAPSRPSLPPLRVVSRASVAAPSA